MKFLTSIFPEKKTDKSTVNVEIDIKVSEVPAPTPAPVETKPEPPAPDLATKPADIVGYCFGYVCPAHHVNETFDQITLEGYSSRKVCNKCGEVTRPATVKRTAVATWQRMIVDHFRTPLRIKWEWVQRYDFTRIIWNKHEFIKFLDLVPAPTKSKKKRRT
jgi:hypothetical protein